MKKAARLVLVGMTVFFGSVFGATDSIYDAMPKPAKLLVHWIDLFEFLSLHTLNEEYQRVVDFKEYEDVFAFYTDTQFYGCIVTNDAGGLTLRHGHSVYCSSTAVAARRQPPEQRIDLNDLEPHLREAVLNLFAQQEEAEGFNTCFVSHQFFRALQGFFDFLADDPSVLKSEWLTAIVADKLTAFMRTPIRNITAWPSRMPGGKRELDRLAIMLDKLAEATAGAGVDPDI